jgi:hypothetical protein
VLVFLAYFIRIAKRNNFVEEIFSIRVLFRRENSIKKFKNNGRSFLFAPKMEGTGSVVVFISQLSLWAAPD